MYGSMEFDEVLDEEVRISLFQSQTVMLPDFASFSKPKAASSTVLL